MNSRVHRAYRHWSAGLARFAFILSAVCSSASAEDGAASAREQAQSYFEADEPRKAVATLVEAAVKDPADRLTGGMLYASIRDHVWHIPQILPVQHHGAVKALAFTRDASRLASGSVEGEVFVSTTEPLDDEDAADERLALRSASEVVGLMFSADGQRLAVSGKNGPLQVWDVSVRPAKVVFEAPVVDGAVTAFAPAGVANLVALGTASGRIQIVDIALGKEVANWETPGGGAVRALVFSSSGERLAAACGDAKARVWKAQTGQVLNGGIAHRGPVLTVDFSADERYLVTGGQDKVAKLSDIDSGVPVMPALDCGAVVTLAKVSPDGSMIATVLDDWSVLFWDAITGARLPANLREDAAFNDFAWSRAGMRAATASDAGHATLWTVRSGWRRGELMPHDSPVLRAVMSYDSVFLASGSADGMARVWRADGGMPLPTVRSHLARARTAFYSADGEHLVTTSDDHTALHWTSGRLTPTGPALVHRGNVTCGVFDSDATRILTGDETGIAQLWKAETGQPDGDPYVHKQPVRWVDFHPGDARFVTVSGKTATIWGVADHQKPLATIEHPGSGKSELTCARFSPNRKWLVTASTDGTARIWDASTFQFLDVKIDRGFPVLCVRFSPDSTRLVVTGEDAQAAVYDTATWQIVGTPVLAPGPVVSAAITEDNQFIVISSLLLDAVQFYEVQTGRAVGRGLVIPSQATCVDYLLQDKVVVVACDDGTVRALEAPFVTQKVPSWVAGFTERLIGLRKTGPDTFERVNAHIGQLRNYVSDAARSNNFDFPRLVRWKMTVGTQRNGMPKFTSTIARNIERRVDERSASALFECYESISGDPLIIGALSLYSSNPRQGEFMADLVLNGLKSDPLSRCFAAGTLIQAGRSAEAEAIVHQAVADAPDDPRVLRRAAKMSARLQSRAETVELFEKALALDPDAETFRAYAWVLYHFSQPEKALEQFRRAQELVGPRDDDLVAGVCLCSAALKQEREARDAYQQLVAIEPSWKNADYISRLRGWTQGELSALERIRQSLFARK